MKPLKQVSQASPPPPPRCCRHQPPALSLWHRQALKVCPCPVEGPCHSPQPHVRIPPLTTPWNSLRSAISGLCLVSVLMAVLPHSSVTSVTVSPVPTCSSEPWIHMPGLPSSPALLYCCYPASVPHTTIFLFPENCWCPQTGSSSYHLPLFPTAFPFVFPLISLT